MIKYIIKNNNRSNNTQLTYIRFKPKSFNTIKYSQSLKLILFHITTINIKSYKGSHYSHLLIN